LLLIFYKFGGKSKCMYVENIFLVHYSPPIDVRTCMLIWESFEQYAYLLSAIWQEVIYKSIFCWIFLCFYGKAYKLCHQWILPFAL
jgi:hypothetical protein